MRRNGVNHVAILTHHTGRLAAFYREVFDAEIGSHLEEFDGAVQLTFIRIGETAELNVFQVAGNTEADRQSPVFGRAASAISGCKPRRSTRLTRSGPADRPGRQRSLGHRFRSRPEHLLPGPGRPRG